MERKAFWRDLHVSPRIPIVRTQSCLSGSRWPTTVRVHCRQPNTPRTVACGLADAERYRLAGGGRTAGLLRFFARSSSPAGENAIDVDVLGAPKRSIRSDSVLNLVYVGRLAEVKGVFEALEAAALLRDEGISVNLAIAGSGPAERQLRLRIAELGIEDRVTLKGPLFGAEKNELWLNSDAFLFPTSHHEGLPYALLESMAAGTVPVTCPVGAIPDVIEHQKHGLFFHRRMRERSPRLSSGCMSIETNYRDLERLRASEYCRTTR